MLAHCQHTETDIVVVKDSHAKWLDIEKIFGTKMYNYTMITVVSAVKEIL